MANHRVYNDSGDALYIKGSPDPINSLLLPTIEFDHHQVHEGEAFQWTYGPIALANGASFEYQLIVGAVTNTTRTPHLVIECDSTVETWLHLFEGPTITVAGTAKVPLNRNRGSVAACNAVLKETPTASADGTQLTAFICGAGKSGGQARGAVEWVLKPSTVYLIRATAKTTGDNICLRMEFYEDTGV